MKNYFETNLTMQDFGQVAEHLIRMMFVLTEQRINSQQDREKPVGRALAETALTINAALRFFILIEKLHGK
jgi:hypothetical protein